MVTHHERDLFVRVMRDRCRPVVATGEHVNEGVDLITYTPVKAPVSQNPNGYNRKCSQKGVPTDKVYHFGNTAAYQLLG